MTDIIEKLKKGARNWCRERVIEARENSKGPITATEPNPAIYGLRSRLKEMRGGLSQGL